MTLEERIGILGAAPEMTGLPGPALAAMAAATREERFRPGETIVGSGEAADRVFVLAEGTATVTRGGLPLRRLGPGTLVGEIAFLVDGLRTATVVAVSECTLLSLPYVNFRELLLSHPRGALAVAARLARQLVEAEALLTRHRSGEDRSSTEAAAPR